MNLVPTPASTQSPPYNSTTCSRKYASGHVRNILSTFYLAEPADLTLGLTWYPRAHARVLDLAERYEVLVSHAAGVVAALSPHNSWSQNLKDAEAILQAPYDRSIRVCTFGSNRDKARDIAQGKSPEVVLGGPKVQAFWRLLVDPEADDVVVDGHALAIWAGKEYQPVESMKVWPQLYVRVAGEYRAAAEVLGLRPSEVQATTWMVWHRIWKIQERSVA